MVDHLFTYGLLRREANHEMSQLLTQSADFVSKATFQGKLYRVDYYPGVIPSENQEDIVFGDVYQISNLQLLKRLDRFEGIGPEFSQPNEYRREVMGVMLVNGTKLTAWIYLYNWDLDGSDRIYSGDFLNPTLK